MESFDDVLERVAAGPEEPVTLQVSELGVGGEDLADSFPFAARMGELQARLGTRELRYELFWTVRIETYLTSRKIRASLRTSTSPPTSRPMGRFPVSSRCSPSALPWPAARRDDVHSRRYSE